MSARLTDNSVVIMIAMKNKKAKDDDDDDNISPSKGAELIREQLMLKMTMLRN